MRILWVKDDVRRYIAKIYWALQKGLRLEADFKSWGKNEDHYESVRDYKQLVRACDFHPDLIISDYKYHQSQYRYRGLKRIDCKRAFIFGDYWNVPSRESLSYGLQKGGITDIFVFFKDAFDKYPELGDRMHWLQPSIDSEIFKDWGLKKEYLIGFLGADCHKYKKPYKDRYRITRVLENKFGKSFFTQKHPGWGFFNEETPLIGKGFSQAINKCTMFVTTAGAIGHCNPKYYEIAASGSLLICTKAAYMEECGFIDGETCVVITEENMLGRIDHYLTHPEETDAIIARAKAMIAAKHTGEIRAKELVNIMEQRT